MKKAPPVPTDFSARESRKQTRDTKTAAELVREIISPTYDPEFEELRFKSSVTMNERELQLC